MTPQKGKVTAAQVALPWWVSPAGLHVGFLIPVFLLVTYAAHSNFSGLTVRGIWFLTDKYVVLGVTLIILTAIGAWIGAQIATESNSVHAESSERWEFSAIVVGLIALAAYLYFFRPLLLNPILLIKTFTGAYRPDRNNLELTAGITSFDNFTPVFFSIYAYKTIRQRAGAMLSTHILAWILLGLTALRVYAWGERLALIETLVPFGLSAASRLNATRNPLVRTLGSGGPFFAIPLLVLYFGIAESVRSWTASVYHARTGFWEFAVGRIASYYITSLNNGAGLLQRVTWPTFTFQYTAAWLYKIPFFGPTFAAYLSPGVSTDSFIVYLYKYGDPEFNNPSGNYSVICDLGLPLGIAYFMLMGFFGGVLYRRYVAGTMLGVLIYPIFFLTFLEIFRYPYLGTQRAFVWMLGVVLAALLGRRSMRVNRAEQALA